jgi:polysaccharide export outer membrane protein
MQSYLPFAARHAAILFLTWAASAYGQAPLRNAPVDHCNGPMREFVPGCDDDAGANGMISPPGAIGVTGVTSRVPVVPPNPTYSNAVPPRPSLPEPLDTRATLPPELPGEFQRFAAASVGAILPVFGASFFDKAPTTFAPIERAPVTADYVVGPGDQILLRVWGQVNLNLELTVDRSGAVYIPQTGSVTVTGLQFHQLTAFLRTRLEKVFRNFELSVNMGQLRSIQLFVVGQARRPGSYTVSSLSTLVNTLFASGGPSVEGSMRRIQLKRDSRVVTEFDVYDLLLDGDKSKDVRLLPGDVIYIPPAGPQVAVAGSVKIPAIYELKTETPASELVRMAGGLTQVADLRRGTLERIGNGNGRQTVDLSLDASGLAMLLENGDILQVASIQPRFSNVVTLRGNVAEPGRFPWKSGMRLRDLIPDKESLVTRSYWLRHNVMGFTPLMGFTPPIGVMPVKEAIDKPAGIKLEREMVPINWAYAVIERRDPRDLSTQLLPFSPGKLVLEGEPNENLELSPGDIVTIFSQTDIRVPQAQQVRVVRLEGEIRSAGIYTARKGETLEQLVARAGGLTAEAYPYGAEFLRESTRREQQFRMDRLVQEWDREVQQEGLQRAQKSPSPDDAARELVEQEQTRRLLERMRSIKATGRIVLGLARDQSDLRKLMDLPLEDGDVFMVPARPATINVLGAVYNQNAFLHEENLRVSDYLKAAGGATRTADKDKVYIFRADGSVVPREGASLFRQKFEDTNLNPGDSVVVPEAFPKASFLRGLRDWTQVFSQLVLGAAAINVLR